VTGIGVNRGATVLGDRVFMITDHAHVLASTPRAAMGSGDGFVIRSYSATSPPLPVGDLLVVGVGGGRRARISRRVRASTGEAVWRFYTIPARGEPGRNVGRTGSRA
jgi:alcohol dehydrogenase (cytochrome c)